MGDSRPWLVHASPCMCLTVESGDDSTWSHWWMPMWHAAQGGYLTRSYSEGIAGHGLPFTDLLRGLAAHHVCPLIRMIPHCWQDSVCTCGGRLEWQLATSSGLRPCI